MLKPRFKNMADMLNEFKASLEYMDKDMPKDTSLLKKEKQPEARPVVESVQRESKPKVLAEAAPLSRYSSVEAAKNSFRVLAGLEEREVSPWNPGILGESRTVRQIQEDFGMVTKSRTK